jgi:hypothetical protein
LPPSLFHAIYHAADALPASWDSVAGGNIFLTRDYMAVLEQSAPENMTCFFIGIFNEEALAGVAIAQFLDLAHIASFGERDNCLKTKIRTVAFKNFASRVLILGNNMLTGQNTFRFTPGTDLKTGISALAGALENIKSGLKSQGRAPHLTIWKDFTDLERPGFESGYFKRYFRFSTQPNMVFHIRPQWQSEADYVAALNKKYRDQYKRARKKAEAISKRKLDLDEIIALNGRVNELYLTVVGNAPFNTFYLRENHFVTLKRNFAERFLFYGYFETGKLVGFDTLIKNGDATDTYFLGYDDEIQREKMLYLNMLYNMIGYSINKGFRKVIFARTALEIKSAVGAKPEYLHGFIRHAHPILNALMPRIFHFFEPDIKWQQRHPFKD